MRLIKRLRPSPATVIASIALLVALSGTSYAAFALAPHSVGNLQLKTGAVNTRVLADHGIKAVDLAPGVTVSGPAGPTGPAGAAGATGPAGPAGPGAKWALIKGNGDIIAQSGGITVSHPFTGGYYVKFDSAVTGKNVTATNAYRDSDTSARSGPLVTICGEGTEGSSCSFSDNAQTVYVGTSSTAGVPENHAFYVAVF